MYISSYSQVYVHGWQCMYVPGLTGPGLHKLQFRPVTQHGGKVHQTETISRHVWSV